MLKQWNIFCRNTQLISEDVQYYCPVEYLIQCWEINSGEMLQSCHEIERYIHVLSPHLTRIASGVEWLIARNCSIAVFLITSIDTRNNHLTMPSNADDPSLKSHKPGKQDTSLRKAPTNKCTILTWIVINACRFLPFSFCWKLDLTGK